MFYTFDNAMNTIIPEYVFNPALFKPVNSVLTEAPVYGYAVNPEAVSEGMEVRAENGKLVYSNGTDSFSTDIPAVFDDVLYATYEFGNLRGRAFGCLCDYTQRNRNKGCLPGDVDGNGAVNINDATLLQGYLADMISSERINLGAAELYHEKNCFSIPLFSQYITIKNVTDIQRYIAEFISEFNK